MSIWTSNLALGLAAAAIIAAGAATAQQVAPRKASVSEGAITVAGPSGYCVDRESSQLSADTAFVFLGSCAALNGKGAGPRLRAVLTASVQPGAPAPAAFRAQLRDLAAFLTTDAGRASLARDGKARSVQIAEILLVGDALFLRVRDRAPLAGHRVVPEYWRAILARRGRLVSLSVLSLAEAPVATADMRDLLDEFVARVASANR